MNAELEGLKRDFESLKIQRELLKRAIRDLLEHYKPKGYDAIKAEKEARRLIE